MISLVLYVLREAVGYMCLDLRGINLGFIRKLDLRLIRKYIE